MRKIISMILAMAMIVTTFGAMTAFATVADATFGIYGYSAHEIYNKDYNEYAPGDSIASGTYSSKDEKFYLADGTTSVSPSKVEYVTSTRPGGGTALKISVDETVEFDAEKSKNGTYMVHFHGETVLSGIDKGQKAQVHDFWAMFPSVPEEAGKAVRIWNTVRQKKGDAAAATNSCQTEFVSDGEGNMVITKGTNSASIAANQWFRYTAVTDFEEMIIYYYIDGEFLGTWDISGYGTIVNAGYFRIKDYNNLDDGMVVDDVHTYLSTDVAPEDTSNPYKYSVSGAGLDFEDYTISTYVKNSSGSNATQLGVSGGISTSGSTWSITADPEDSTNDVLLIDATSSTGDIYWNYSGLGSYSFKDVQNNAVVLDMDIYVDDASKLGTSGTSLLMGKCVLASGNKFIYVYAVKSSDDVVGIKFNTGAKTVKFAEKEWHNVSIAYTPSDNKCGLYVDGEFVETITLATGDTFSKLDYWRTQIGSANKAKIYFDNYHLYEGTKIPATITATDYVAGTSKVGDSVTLTATNYVIGQTATIEKSTDGTTWTDLETASTSVTLTTDSVYYRAKVGTLYSEPVVLYGVAAEGHPYNYIVKEGPLFTFDDITIVEPTSSAAGYFKRDNVTVTGLNGGSIIAGEATSKATISDSPSPAFTGDKAFVYSVNSSEETKKQVVFSQQAVINATGTDNAIVLEFDRYVKSADAGTEAKSNMQFIYPMITVSGSSRAADPVYMSRAANGTWTMSWGGSTIYNATAFKEDQWNHIAYIFDHKTNVSYVYINNELVAEKTYAASVTFDYLRANGFGTQSFPMYMDNWHMYVAQQGEKPVVSKNVWDLDFEDLTIANNKVSTANGTPIQNSVNGQFNAKANLELATSSSDATPNGETASLSIEAVPAAYAAGHGDALKYVQTGGGYAATPAMIIMYLGNGGNNFGSPNADGNTPAAGDLFVTEFDFAFDSADMDGAIEIGQFRGSTINGRYVTLAKNASNHFTFAGADYGIKIEGNKWYHVKVVADPATSVVRCYVDGVFAGTQDYSSTGIGLWESFRLFGGTSPNAVGVSGLWYDNFEAYVTAPYTAPTVADIKLSTIAYDNNGAAVDTMGAYSALNATATVTNNGVAAQAVVIFARYTNNGRKLAAVTIKPISMLEGQTSISVKGALGASNAGDSVKVFIWDGLGTLVPGVVTANNASL
ncbi:MAG: hypothetical protein IJD36_04710 [Clostridia bacterium]|nr:hypothetical protein [Clostridia bacterium]